MMVDNNRSFDVCIMCALAEEAKALLEVIKQRCRVSFDQGYSTNNHYEYRYTTIQNNRGEPLSIHISWPPNYGPLETSLHFKPILKEFHPRFAAMTGICAGDKRKVKLGDLVVAKHTYFYDNGKIVVGEDGQKEHLHNVQTYNMNHSVLQSLQMFDAWKPAVAELERPYSIRQQREWILNTLLGEATPQLRSIDLQELNKYAPNWRKIVEKLQDAPNPYLTREGTLRDPSSIFELRYGREEFPFKDPLYPECHIKPMASGSAVRSDDPFKDVQVPVRETVAIDMEGAAFYRTVEESRGTCSLLVKGVCDYADPDKDDTYHQYASLASATYLLCFIQEYVTEERMPRPRIDVVQKNFVDLPLDTIPEVATLPPGSRMPFSRNPHFVGHEADLQALAGALKGNKTVVVGQVETAAATGMGGVGKTQFASEFVHRYGQYFTGGVFWLSFANTNTVQAEIADCGNMVDLEKYPDFRGLPPEARVQLVLSTWQSPTPRLLVFDNCEDEVLFNRWRPQTGGCRILITSLRPHWASELGIKVLPLDCLQRDESTKLLCEYREDLNPNDSDLHSIADLVGDLPLALHLAGRFLQRYRYTNNGVPGIYLERLRQVTPIKHFSLQAEGITFTTEHIQHVERTFAMAYERLDTDDLTDQQALKLLARAIFFAPNLPIRRNILRGTIRSANNSPENELLAEEALERLINLGLMDDFDGGDLRLHRLIAEFVKSRIGTDTEAQTAVEQVMLQASLELNILRYSTYMYTFHPHLRAVTDRAMQRNDVIAAQLCNAQGSFLMISGAYLEAHAYLERALDIYEKQPEQDREGYVTICNNLAQIYEAQYNFEKAREFAQRSLEAGERRFGSDHLLISDSLNILSKLCLNEGNLIEAEKLSRRALKIRRQLIQTDNHPDLAIQFNYLAQILLAQDKYKEAESYFKKALDIWRSLFGENHPDIAHCLESLAKLYRMQHKYVLAEQTYKDALSILERVLGKDHIQVAYSLNGLASYYNEQGKHKEAEPLYVRSWNILKRILEIKHPHTISALRTLVQNYLAQGKSDLAELLLLQVADNQAWVFGSEHFVIGQCFEDLAGCYGCQHEYVKAVQFFEKTLMIYEQIEGPENPDVHRVTSQLQRAKQKRNASVE